jgi:hypothetical protein
MAMGTRFGFPDSRCSPAVQSPTLQRSNTVGGHGDVDESAPEALSTRQERRTGTRFFVPLMRSLESTGYLQYSVSIGEKTMKSVLLPRVLPACYGEYNALSWLLRRRQCPVLCK